jgi:hypothetical protein
LAVLLGLSLVAFISMLSLAQATSSSAGNRMLARTAATITDVDAALPGIESALRESASEPAQDPVTVPNYPIPVRIPRDEALTLTGAELRDRILATSGDALYNDGVSVWADGDPEASQQIGRGSTAGAVRLGVGFVGDTQHTVFLVLAGVAGVATLVLAAALTAQMTALRRLVALGGIVVASAGPALLVALVMGVVLPSFGGDRFTDDVLDIVVDAQSVAVRNFLIVSLLGLAVATVGFVGTSMATRAEQTT